MLKLVERVETEDGGEKSKQPKGNNSCKSRSSVTNLKLDLYYFKTYSCNKYQFNILKDDLENFGKQIGQDTECTDSHTNGRADGQTDWLTA